VSFSSKNLATFYYQLGTLVQAGVSIQSALLSARKTSPRAMRSTVAELSDLVNQGMPVNEAMERCGQRFAPLDKHALDMSGRSGALDIGLLSLSKYYESRADGAQQTHLGLDVPGGAAARGGVRVSFPRVFSRRRRRETVHHARLSAGHGRPPRACWR
jgi:hypothetical protein